MIKERQLRSAVLVERNGGAGFAAGHIRVIADAAIMTLIDHEMSDCQSERAPEHHCSGCIDGRFDCRPLMDVAEGKAAHGR